MDYMDNFDFFGFREKTRITSIGWDTVNQIFDSCLIESNEEHYYFKLNKEIEDPWEKIGYPYYLEKGLSELIGLGFFKF